MCLAVPGKLMTCDGDSGVVDMQGNHFEISTTLTPEAQAGDWVLVHAGFAISMLSEKDALETWDYVRKAFALEAAEEAGLPLREAKGGPGDG